MSLKLTASAALIACLASFSAEAASVGNIAVSGGSCTDLPPNYLPAILHSYSVAGGISYVIGLTYPVTIGGVSAFQNVVLSFNTANKQAVTALPESSPVVSNTYAYTGTVAADGFVTFRINAQLSCGATVTGEFVTAGS